MKTFSLPRTLLAFSLVLGVCMVPSTAEDKADAKVRKTEKKTRVGKLQKSLARLDKSGKLIVEYTVTVPVLVQRVKVVNGKEVKVTVARSVRETRARVLAKGTYRVFNSAGDPIQADALAKLLKDKRPVYVARDKLPDAKQLKRLGKEAVIIVQERKKPKAGKQ